MRSLNLSYDVQFDLFDKTIKPILLYGCEIWGFGNTDIIERIHLKFLKLIFKLKRSTPSFMLYGELGLTPITTDIQARMVAYWSKLLENKNFKITSTLYTEIYHIHTNGIYKSKYIENINSYLTKTSFLAFGFLKTSKIQNGFQNVSNKN